MEGAKHGKTMQLTLSLPVTRICVNYSTVYNDTLVAKGLNLFLVEITLAGVENLRQNDEKNHHVIHVLRFMCSPCFGSH